MTLQVVGFPCPRSYDIKNTYTPLFASYINPTNEFPKKIELMNILLLHSYRWEILWKEVILVDMCVCVGERANNSTRLLNLAKKRIELILL